MASLGELGIDYEELVAFERRHLIGMQVCRRSNQVNASLTTGQVLAGVITIRLYDYITTL